MNSGPAQLTFGLGELTEYREEDFLVSGSNAMAHGWITRWPDWPGTTFLLYGPHGSGKTHLSHLWSERSNARSLITPSVPENMSAGILENIQRFAEADLFHFLNEAREKQCPLLLTLSGEQPFGSFRLPDLISRLSALPCAALEAPDDALLTALLTKYFADRQLRVDPPAIAFLVARMERNFMAAQVLATEIDRVALAAQKPVTIPLLRQILAENAISSPA